MDYIFSGIVNKRGENSNGKWWQLPNGLLVCQYFESGIFDTSLAVGSYFDIPQWEYPKKFGGDRVVSVDVSASIWNDGVNRRFYPITGITNQWSASGGLDYGHEYLAGAYILNNASDDNTAATHYQYTLTAIGEYEA